MINTTTTAYREMCVIIAIKSIQTIMTIAVNAFITAIMAITAIKAITANLFITATIAITTNKEKHVDVTAITELIMGIIAIGANMAIT